MANIKVIKLRPEKRDGRTKKGIKGDKKRIEKQQQQDSRIEGKIEANG